MGKYLVLLLFIGVGSAGVLMTNGTFEQALTVGWSQAIGTPLSSDTIDRQIYFDPDADYEARVKKYDATHAILYQTVNIPTTDLNFSVNAKLYAYEDNSTTSYWAAAAVILRYLDNSNNLLGETRIAYKSPHCPWTNSNTVHIITVTNPNNWSNYSFNIDSELSNLPLLNPRNIKKIQIALLDTTDGC